MHTSTYIYTYRPTSLHSFGLNFYCVIIGAQYKDEIDYLAERFRNTTPIMLELHRSQEEIEQLIKDHDIVVR